MCYPYFPLLQAKLHAANEEKGATGQEMTTLQQEENVSISGSNARLMIMKKLSRKAEVRPGRGREYVTEREVMPDSSPQQSKVVVLRNMVTAEDLDEELEEEVTSECSKYGNVERVIIYQERQGMEDDAEVIIKIFVIFSLSTGEWV